MLVRKVATKSGFNICNTWTFVLVKLVQIKAELLILRMGYNDFVELRGTADRTDFSIFQLIVLV